MPSQRPPSPTAKLQQLSRTALARKLSGMLWTGKHFLTKRIPLTVSRTSLENIRCLRSDPHAFFPSIRPSLQLFSLDNLHPLDCCPS